MLSLDDFTPITLESKSLFDTYYKTYPPAHSDYVFTTMISWNPYAHYEYAVVEQSIIIKTMVQGKIYLRPPIGKPNATVFEELLSLAKRDEVGYQLSLVTDPWKTWIQQNYPKASFLAQPEYDDYIYLSSDLAELDGSAYRKIRNRLNKFTRQNVYETEVVTEENISDVKRFLQRWCIWRDCEEDPLLQYEKKAVMFSMDHFKELALSGIAIRVNDRIEAVAIYEQMNPDTTVVHFEKGSPYFDGIYKVINKETAQYVQQYTRFINRESDMGNPGLRKAKQSYNPHHMIHVFTLQLKS